MEKTFRDHWIKKDVAEQIERLCISAGVTEKDVSAGYAGDVPNSLLAGQDLEGSTTDKGIFVPHEDIITEMMMHHGLDELTARDILATVLGFGKGVVDNAKKELIDAAQDTDASKSDIAARIKAVQLKTQGATIAARERAGEAKGKSFADVWNGSRA